MEFTDEMTSIPNENEEVIEEISEEPVVERERVEEPHTSSRPNSNFDSIFDNLYSDVAGANNFINTLIEQKKSVGANEAFIQEEKEKLAKEKSDFEEYMKAQRESIEIEKQRIVEIEKAQKVRLENEQRAFDEEVAATRKDLELAALTNKNNSDKLENERLEFDKYRDAEEEAIRLGNEKLEMEQAEFAKAKELEYSKIEAEKNKNKLDRETYEKETQNTSERLRLANEELTSARQEFEKYKDVEKQKLELESKNLSQSCARFKELVSQFNSGFKDLPSDK